MMVSKGIGIGKLVSWTFVHTVWLLSLMGGVPTDFGGRSMSYTTKEGLTDYDEASSLFNANIAKTVMQYSTAEYIAEGIYKAATDGTTKLRYQFGVDAEELYANRRKAGDQEFVNYMNAQLFEY